MILCIFNYEVVVDLLLLLYLYFAVVTQEKTIYISINEKTEYNLSCYPVCIGRMRR